MSSYATNRFLCKKLSEISLWSLTSSFPHCVLTSSSMNLFKSLISMKPVANGSNFYQVSTKS